MRAIDADELKKNFQDELCKGIACAECSMMVEDFCRVERWIDIAPTIEAEPVKHGRWVHRYGDGHTENAITGGECSLCGFVNTVTNYCPNCGAKMDEVEE